MIQNHKTRCTEQKMNIGTRMLLGFDLEKWKEKKEKQIVGVRSTKYFGC